MNWRPVLLMQRFTGRCFLQEDGSPHRFFVVNGEALLRFAQMTNWDYYEAVARFQRVLNVSGVNSALKAKEIKEGDTVVLGETEFTWDNDQSDGALYESWLEDMRARGRNVQGISAWPKMRV